MHAGHDEGPTNAICNMMQSPLCDNTMVSMVMMSLNTADCIFYCRYYVDLKNLGDRSPEGKPYVCNQYYYELNLEITTGIYE